jgi:hypothetical protein
VFPLPLQRGVSQCKVTIMNERRHIHTTEHPYGHKHHSNTCTTRYSEYAAPQGDYKVRRRRGGHDYVCLANRPRLGARSSHQALGEAKPGHGKRIRKNLVSILLIQFSTLLCRRSQTKGPPPPRSAPRSAIKQTTSYLNPND